MADEVGIKIVRIVYDASKAREGAAQARRSLEEIEKQAVQTGSTISRMEGTLGALGAGFSRVTRFAAAFGVALSLAGGVAMARDVMQTVGSLGSLAEQLTTNTRHLQGMQFAATGANVRIDDLEKGAAAFALKIGQASEGNKDAIETFQRLGVKILDLRGNVRPFNDLLTESAQKLGAIDNANVKSALSTELFDKAGRKMLTLLPDLARGQESLAQQAERAGAMISPDTIDKWDKVGSAAEKAGLQTRAFFAELGAPIATAGLQGVSTMLGEIVGQLERGRASGKGFWETVLADSRKSGRLGSGPNALRLATPEEQEAHERAALEKERGQQWNADSKAHTQAKIDKFEREKLLEKQASMSSEEDWARRIKLRPSEPSSGAGDPRVKGAGAADGDRISKLQNTLLAAAEAQDVMTAAALRGNVAFQDQEIKAKSVEQAMQAYGDKLDRNHPRVKALAAEVEQFNRRVVEGKAAEAFALQTTELAKQNEILTAELRLINEFPEVRARELALIRAKHEAEKGGKAVTAEMLEQRRGVIEQNETLKIQQEELRRSQELWTEPFKQALRDIQSLGANMFDSMLERGSFSFQELGNIARTVGRRIVSELASLAIIRPMVGSIAGALGDVGILSQSSVRQMGFGGSGGGHGGGMPSFGGGGGGSLGSMFGFLNQPITGGGIDREIANWSTYGTSAQNSMGGFLGNTTWGQGLGAAAGIGMGAYQLATSKNTAGTIGGIGSMVGGIVSMLPIPGAQIVGPLISMASAILPGLFGGEEYKWDPLAGGNVQFNPGAAGYTSVGTTQQGGRDIAGQFAGVGSTLDTFFKRSGGITNAGNAFGMSIWNNQREGTTSGYLLSPSQGSNQQIRDLSGDPSQAIDRLIAKVFYNSIQNNAAMDASPTLRTAFTNREPTSTAQVTGLLDLIDVYDQLGKTTSQAETALKEIDERFASLTTTATEWGLALAPIEAEQKKQTERMARDFIDGLIDPAAVALRGFDDEKRDILASTEYIKANTSVHVDMARINEALLRKEAALKEQFYGQTVGQLEEAIRRLSPGGALANLDPRGTLAGLEATYQATRAQAFGGDQAAMARIAGEGTQLAEFSKSFYAGSQEYNRQRDQLLADFEELAARAGGPVQASGTEGTATSGATSGTVQQLMAVVQKQSTENAGLRSDLARLTNLLSRYLTNGGLG